MIPTKLRTAAALVIAAVLMCASVTVAFAAEDAAAHSQAQARYTNPETGYQVLIMDDIDLLDSEEEALLAEDMKPVTQYGHAVFWTTDLYAYDEIDQARQMRRNCYELDSASIFAINMNVRKLTIQSYGTLYNLVNDSTARSITDNVSHYATSKKYYDCAREAFGQIAELSRGGTIAEPMKYLSYVVISLMLGVIIALALAFSKTFNPLRKSVAPPETVGSGTLMTAPMTTKLIRTETIVVQSSSGGGGGCGGGGGGGGCGGGGSSSF